MSFKRIVITLLLFALSVFGQQNSKPSGPPGSSELPGPAPDQRECKKLWYSSDSDTPLCLCNAIYCDTIPPVQKLSESQYVSYTSSKAGLRFKKETASFTKQSSNNLTITINIEKTYQSINGWGGAFTDAAGININTLNDGAKEKLMRSYFSLDGLEYNLGRVPIAGCDFSTHYYSYDDGPKDVKLKNFKLAEEDFTDKIPLIKQAQLLSNKTLMLLGSAWTAPKWMQTNHSSNNIIKKSMYQVWANYYIKFLEAYAKEGVHFWGITTGNEPIATSFDNLFMFISWSLKNLRNWVSNNFGPTVRNSNFSGVKILGLDDQRTFLSDFVSTVLSSKKAKGFIDGIALHWYLDFETSPSVLNTTHNKYPDTFILNTEACIMDVRIGQWKYAESYATYILQDLNNWVTGWIDWNLALDMNGGPNFVKNYVSSPIVINAARGEFYKQATFYALGHFSKFIPRGSIRVDHECSDENLQTVVFKRPDGGIAVVVLNRKDDEVQLVLKDKRRGIIIRSIEAKSITTILYW